MHFVTLVLVPMEHEDDPLSEVPRLLKPYQWYLHEYDRDLPDGHREEIWDWWQFGGRWTGWLDPEYDPREDPANQEGESLKWPIFFRPHAGDILPTGMAVERLAGRLPAAILADGEWYQEPAKHYDPKGHAKWPLVVDEVLQQHLDTLTVVVDCHM